MAEQGGIGGVRGPVPLPGLAGPELPPELGRTDTRSVSKLANPANQLDEIDPDATSSKSLPDRSLEEVEGKPTEGLKKTEEKEDNRTPDELKADQAKAFEKAGELTEKYEQHSVLGRALNELREKTSELEDMKGASKPRKVLKALKEKLSEKTDLKVTITLAGSNKPITLIPLNEKELGNENLEALLELAEKVLTEHQAKEFSNFDAAATAEELNSLYESIKKMAEKLGDKDKEEGEHEYEKKWKEVRHKPATVVAGTDEASIHVERIQSERAEKEKPEKPKPDPASEPDTTTDIDEP